MNKIIDFHEKGVKKQQFLRMRLSRRVFTQQKKKAIMAAEAAGELTFF